MAEILFVNPRARKRKSTTRRKPRTAAQKRATAKMVAANRRRRNPAPKVASNPTRRRKRRSGTVAVRRRRRNPVAAYRRNPSRRGGLKLNNLIAPLTDAGLMAAGALGIHAAWAHLAPMIPPTVKNAMPGMGHALKAATALGIGGLLLPMVTSKANAHKITAGAVAVVITGFLWPRISPHIVPASADTDVDGLGMWLNNDPGMGYLYNDAAFNGVGQLPDYSGVPSYSGYNSAALD